MFLHSRHVAGLVSLSALVFTAAAEEPRRSETPATQATAAADLAHIREELGVNQFTAPSIASLSAELEALAPFPFEKVWRDLPDATPHDRPRLALATGQIIADGFLVVAAQKQSRLEPVGRLLLRYAKGLGVGNRVTRQSRSIMELATRQRWGEIQRELVKAQAEVEAGMMQLKDEEIAHLVSLGGWLRGLEIASTAVTESYTPQRAARLSQPELFGYFLERVETLQPALRSTPLFETLVTNLRAARALIQNAERQPLTPANVKALRDLSRVMNRAIENQ